MAMVGAFLGGPGTTIPAGSGIMKLQWVTSDGLNQTVSFKITGPETKTLQSDANGYISEMVQAGTYTVEPIHEGQYSGDDAKQIIVPNRDEASVVWFATVVYPQNVVFSSPSNLIGSTYKLSDEKGEIASGSDWNSNMTFSLYPANYTLEIRYAGATLVKTFAVSTSPISIDLSGDFCKVEISSSVWMPTTVTINGEVSTTTFPFYLIKENNTRSLSFSGGIPQYSGVTSSSIAEWNSKVIVPNSPEITVALTYTPKTVLITSSGTLNIPRAGTYNVGCIGGGARGSTGGSGGCSGIVSVKDVVLPVSSIPVTIGAGGASSNVNGGATSLGSYISASGGTISSGGSGGGASGYSSPRPGSFGGGGGASSGMRGANGGTYGGKGGDVESSGSSGVSASSRDDVFQSTLSYNGGAAGTATAGSGGGGGGGGLGASGGKGGSAVSRSNGGGGGGGGIAGGTGGAGGNGISSSSAKNGSGGYGYGAGGGGGYSDDAPNANICGGGGGGGGYGSSVKASMNGYRGCILIKWRHD